MNFPGSAMGGCDPLGLRLLWALILVLFACSAPARSEPFAGSPLGPIVAQAFAGGDNPEQGNRIANLSGGYDALLLRVHLIRQARTSIEIQTFIWSNDEAGRLLVWELIQAARRGVKVRIIADHLASDQDVATAAFLTAVNPNLELKYYRPALSRLDPSLAHLLAAGLTSFHAVNQRMHNKLMVFDGAVMITGGRNIENTYFDHATGLNFRDRDIVATGPVVRSAVASFEQFWSFRYAVASRDLTDVSARLEQGRFRRYETREEFNLNGYFTELDREADDAALIEARFARQFRPVARVVFIADDPGKTRGFFTRNARITRELRRTLQDARESIVMQTPYLILSRPARRLFQDLRNRNPELRIRISSNSFASTDNILAYSGNYRLRGDYVNDLRMEVYEYKPRPASLDALFPRHVEMERIAAERSDGGKPGRPFLCIHAKSLVIDDRITFIGSYNLDPRSENLNTEVGLLIEDEAFAREIRAEIEHDMQPENSWVIGPRRLPLRLDVVNGLVDGVMRLSPVDAWPIQNTSSFELRPGAEAVRPWDPAFHENYSEVGSFPGTEGLFTTKEILTRLYKAVGPAITPVL